MGDGAADDPRRPLLVATKTDPASTYASLSERPSHSSPSPITPFLPEEREEDMDGLSRKTQWVILAVASGACAAFNGVFAKLTTTELTTTFATGIANFLGLRDGEKVVEVIIRGLFFALNLIFNGIMWTLFTKALARGTSTTQVSIINTSSNFMITAVLGFIIFSESLPPLWFLGAALLVAGNVIIGRREEDEKDSRSAMDGDSRESGDREEEEGLLRGESVELELEEDVEIRRKRREEEEDILNLGLDDDEPKSEDELI